jgi:hypothetical protein
MYYLSQNQCYQTVDMADCIEGFFANSHGQLVKDGGTMAFYGGNSG